MSLDINIFKNTYDLDCTNVTTIQKVLSAIKKGRWRGTIEALRIETDKKKEEKLKMNLPAVIWSGVFDERCDAGLLKYNHIIVADIDKVPYKRILLLKTEFRKNKHVVAFFESPRRGLKVLFAVDSPPELHNTDAFYMIENMLLDHYGIRIDPSGKNLSRLCYVSYDPDLYFNKDAIVLHVEKTERLEDFKLIERKAEGFIAVYDATKIFDTCIKMVKASKVGSYRKGNRNKFVFCTSCLLSEFGVPENQALSLIISRYTSLDFREMRPTVSSAYRRTKNTHGTRSMSQKSNNQQSLIENA